MDVSQVRWKELSIALNLGGLFLLAATAALVFLWPEHLAAFGLDARTSRMVLLQEISFLLLLAAFQTNLEPFWRRLSLAACFTVMAESTLLALLI